MNVGRPPKANPKNIDLKLRLTRDTADRLLKCAQMLDISRTEVIERGIQKVAEDCGEELTVHFRTRSGEEWSGVIWKKRTDPIVKS
ncbi:MAG: hypothetical protein RSA65_01510 [Clostridia bacterium]